MLPRVRARAREDPPQDPERLADEHDDLLFCDAYWEDGELVVRCAVSSRILRTARTRSTSIA
jgi:hypothetical protein